MRVVMGKEEMHSYITSQEKEKEINKKCLIC